MKGPATAFMGKGQTPTPLLATTKYEKDWVPGGGLPLTAPLGEMVSQEGAHIRRSVGGGLPVAANLYLYIPRETLSGGVLRSHVGATPGVKVRDVTALFVPHALNVTALKV